MKPIEATLKLKRVFTLAGVGLLSLAFFGCGGGGGTLFNDPTLTIAEVPESISRVAGGVRSSNHKLTSGNLEIFTIQGEKLLFAWDQNLDGIVSSAEKNDTKVTHPVTKFPVKFVISSAMKAEVNRSEVLVACLKNGNRTRKSVIRLTAANLVPNASKSDTLNVNSSVVTALLENQLSAQLGAPVNTCEETNADQKAKMMAASEKANGVNELADTFKSAANDGESLLASIASNAADVVVGSDGIDQGAEFRRLLATGKSRTSTKAVEVANIKSLRKLAGAATKLSKQASNASLKTLLKEVVSSKATEAATKAAAGQLIADVAKLKGNGIDTEIDAVLAKTSLKEVISSAQNTLLPVVTSDVTAKIEESGNLGSLSNFYGSVVAADNTAGAAVTSKVQEALKVVTSKKSLLGGVLAASSGTSAAVTAVLNLAINENVGINEVLEEIAQDDESGVDLGDFLVDVAPTIGKDFAGEVNLGLTLSSLIDELDSDDFVALTALEIEGVNISDTARIAGPKAVTIKAPGSITFFNNSIETDPEATYAYKWVHQGISNTTETPDSLGISGLAKGAYTVKLEQSIVGGNTTTAMVSLTVTEGEIVPSVEIASTSVEIKAGANGSVKVAISNAGTNTVKVTAPEGLTAGTLSATGGSLSIKVAAGTAAGSYEVSVTVGTTTKKFTVKVPAAAPTSVFLSGVKDITQGESLTITATAKQEEAVTAGAALRLWIFPGNTASNPNVTKELSVGFTTVSTVLTSLAVGEYTVKADASKGGVNPTTTSLKFFVNAADAPKISEVAVNGSATRRKVVSSSDPATVKISVKADTGATVTVEGETAIEDGSTGNYEATLALGVGEHTLTVTANNGAASSSTKITVTVEQKIEVAVTGVSLSGSINGSNIDASSGNTGTSLPLSMVNGALTVDASAVEGLDLNTLTNDTLAFKVETSGNRNTVYHATISVTLEDALRKATLVVNDAVITAGTTGWDITAASNFSFSGEKADGAFEILEVQSVNGFDNLFEEGTDALQFNLLKLKEAMKALLVEASYPNFAATLDDMSGNDIEVRVSVSAANFSFKYGDTAFDTFAISGIKVD